LIHAPIQPRASLIAYSREVLRPEPLLSGQDVDQFPHAALAVLLLPLPRGRPALTGAEPAAHVLGSKFGLTVGTT
jgi:hypothetical protein